MLKNHLDTLNSIRIYRKQNSSHSSSEIETVRQTMEEFPKELAAIILQYLQIEKQERLRDDQWKDYRQIMDLFLKLSQHNFSKAYLIEEFVYIIKAKQLIEEEKNILLYNIAVLYFQIGAYYRCLETAKKVAKIQKRELIENCYIRSGLNIEKDIKEGEGDWKKQLVNSNKIVQKYKQLRNIEQRDISFQNFRKQHCDKQFKIREFFNLGILLKNKFQQYSLAESVFSLIAAHLYGKEKMKLWLFSQVNLIQICQHLQQFDRAIYIIQLVANSTQLCSQAQDQLARKKQILVEAKKLKTFDKNLYPISEEKTKKTVDKELTYLFDKEKELNKILNKKANKDKIMRDMKKKNKKCPLGTLTAIKSQKLQTQNFLRSTGTLKNTIQTNLLILKQKAAAKQQNHRCSIKSNLKMRRSSRISYRNIHKKVHFIKKEIDKENQDTLNIKTSQLIEEEAYDRLIEKYTQKISKTQNDSERAKFYYEIGELYEKVADKTMAFQSYENALQKGEKRSYLKMALITQEDENAFTSINFLEKYLSQVNEEDEFAEMKLLQAYSRIPQYYSKAFEKLRQIPQSNKYFDECMVLMINVCSKQKNYDKGIEICEKLKRKNAKNYRIYHMMGLLHKLNENQEKSVQSFLTALKINPSSTQSVLQLCGFIQSEDCSYEELISVLRKALFQKENNVQILQIMKQYIETKTINLELITPTMKFAELIEIGDIFFDEGLILQAQYSYKWAAKMSPNSLVHEKLGDILFAKGEFIASEKMYKTSIQKQFDMRVLFKIGNLKMKQGLYNKAIEIFTHCQNQDPNSTGIYLSLIGTCFYELSHYELAKQYFGKAVRSKFKNQKIKNSIFECYSKINSSH